MFSILIDELAHSLICNNVPEYSIRGLATDHRMGIKINAFTYTESA